MKYLIKNLPGDREFGVKGNSLIRFLTFRSIIENNFPVYGFDYLKISNTEKKR